VKVARTLDALAVGLGGLCLAILGTGGFTIGTLALTRAEDVVVALAILLGVRAFVWPYKLPHVRPEQAVLGGVIAYAVLMGFIVVTRHQALRTHALDLGYYVQLVSNMARGFGAYVTLPPMHAFGDHLSPVFYAFVPIAWVWPGAVPLLLAQTFALAAGALAVFGLARRRLKDGGVAAALALLYLVNPSLHGVNIRDIHPQAFAIALVPAAALAFDRRRYGWCALALAVTLSGREDAAIVGVGFGIWMAVARGRWLAGAVVAAVSVGILAVDVKFVMPYFRGEPYPHLQRHAYLGLSLPDILLSLVARPWRWLPVVVTVPKLTYLLAMLAPLGFLPLFAPRVLAAALPVLAVNLLSLDPVLFHHRSQYTAFVLPFLVLAAIDGYRNLRVTLVRHPVSWLTPATAVALGFVVSVVLTARTVNDLTVTRWLLDPAQRAAHHLMAQVPRDPPASVNERLVPHLGARREIYIFPSGVPESEWLLELASNAPKVPPGYLMVACEGPWMLWRRAAPPAR
jgi:uncharacterized membrane protein